jgi:hypothetical protein
VNVAARAWPSHTVAGVAEVAGVEDNSVGATGSDTIVTVDTVEVAVVQPSPLARTSTR